MASKFEIMDDWRSQGWDGKERRFRQRREPRLVSAGDIRCDALMVLLQSYRNCPVYDPESLGTRYLAILEWMAGRVNSQVLKGEFHEEGSAAKREAYYGPLA